MVIRKVLFWFIGLSFLGLSFIQKFGDTNLEIDFLRDLPLTIKILIVIFMIVLMLYLNPYRKK